MAIIGVVADDFTGTASSGVLVARSQAKTGLFFDPEAVQAFQGANQLDAIYVSSNSRHLKPEEAYQKVSQATQALKNMGIQYFSKKIDTTLRGGIGVEIDAMLDTLDDDMIAVMVTAMPQSRRICIGGYSVIDGVILTETPVANDVKTPVTESFVLDLIKKQTKRRVGLITLGNVLNGEETLRNQMKEAVKQGHKVLIIDAITLEHIDRIAKVCVDLNWNVLAVDPGAFTMKLAYQRGIIKEEKPNIPKGIVPEEGKTVFAIIGSANPATKVQVETLCKADDRNIAVGVSPAALIEGGETAQKEIENSVQKIKELFHQEPRPKTVLAETALHMVVDLQQEDERHSYEAGTASRLINKGLAKIAKGVLEAVGQERVAGLFLTGGDTMECVCREIEVECIQAMDNIVAQIDVGRIIGKYHGMPLVAKGGFCGSDDIGIEIVERLLLESARRE